MPNQIQSFRRTVWDPRLLLAQIICLQSAYYSFLSLLLTFVNLVFIGRPVQLRYILSGGYSLNFGLGFSLLFVELVSAMFGGVLMLILVGRAKYCLDFTITMHGLHLFICFLHNNLTLPSTATWWLIWIVSIFAMDLFGEWLCMRYEIEPVLLSQHTMPSTITTNAADISATARLSSVLVLPSTASPLHASRRSQTDSGAGVHLLQGSRLSSNGSSHLSRISSDPNITSQKSI